MSLNFRMDMTGPKISFLRDFHVVLHVGENRGLDEIAFTRQRDFPPASNFAFSLFPASM